jgi:membrane protein
LGRTYFLTIFASYFWRNNNLKNIHTDSIMELYFTGIIIAVSTFLIIGIFHPIVIKTEYYWGTRPWWCFLMLGLICVAAALMISNVIVSSLLGVAGAAFLWAIGELFEQKERVKRGWFPMNPKRKDAYKTNEEQEKAGE